jgi:hypothetical protein
MVPGVPALSERFYGSPSGEDPQWQAFQPYREGSTGAEFNGVDHQSDG